MVVAASLCVLENSFPKRFKFLEISLAESHILTFKKDAKIIFFKTLVNASFLTFFVVVSHSQMKYKCHADASIYILLLHLYT